MTVSFRNLQLLRAALAKPGSQIEQGITAPELRGLFEKWTDSERAELQKQTENSSLPNAFNDVFLSPGYQPSQVRVHALLGPYFGGLTDQHLDTLKELMGRKGPCLDVDPL